MNRRLLAALALVAALTTGCSADPAEPDAADTTRDGAMRFAQCMRDNGVKDFPDPDASGELTVDGVLNGTSLDPNSAAWKKAIEACKELEPAGFTGHRRNAEEQKAALQFAQCMRDNGITDFPDPAPDSPLIDTNRIPSAGTAGGMNALNAAGKKCGHLSEAAGVTGDGS
jgi:hypothetical protein